MHAALLDHHMATQRGFLFFLARGEVERRWTFGGWGHVNGSMEL